MIKSCWLFGHRLSMSYYESDGLILIIEAPNYDATGASHRHVSARCLCCGKIIRVGKVIDPKTSRKATYSDDAAG